MSKRYPLLWPLPLVLILLIFVFSSSRENKQGIYSSQIISGRSIDEIVSEVGEKTDSIVEQVKLDNTELVIAFDEDRPYIHFMSIMNADATFPMVAPTNAISVVPFPISFAEDSASPFSVM